MKKAIAILLVLLVAGVVFGANGDTLNLQSVMAEKTNHGFYAGTAYDSFGDIFGATFADQTVSGLDMEISTPQAVGNYAFASNSKTEVNVVLTASPLVGPGSTNVPYTLVATKGAGTVGSTPVTIALGGTVGTTAIGNVAGSLLTQTEGTIGPKWATYTLTVQFAGAANLEYGLPEADTSNPYVGTVVAAITTN